MTTAVIQPSFASGEVSATLYGRVDLAKYRAGVALAYNFFVDYRGGISNRPGTQYIQQVYKSNKAARLIEFKFGNDQNYILEFGDFYLRIYLHGAGLLETGQTITNIAGNPATVTVTAHGFSNGDWVYLANIVGAAGTFLNGKTVEVFNVTANTFQMKDLRGATIGSVGAYTSGGNAARLYTVTTPWAAEDLALLKYTQIYDVMTIVHRDYQPRTLSRMSASLWQIDTVDIGTTATPPTGLTLATSGAGTVYYSYTVTSVNALGEESQAADPEQVASVNIGTTNGTITVTWNTVAGAIAYNVYKAQLSTDGEVPIGSQHGFIGTVYGLELKDPNIVPDFTTTPPTHDDPFAVSEVESLTVTNGGSGYSLDPTVAIVDGTGTGAVFKAVVVAGVIQGFIKINGGEGYTAPTVNITDGTGTLATATATVGATTGTWPSVTNIFQQRQIYAASDNQPQTLWASRPAQYDNFDISNPVVDNDAYTFTLASKELNVIKSMVAMPGGLVILTAGGAWQLSGGGEGSPITPTKVSATPQAYNGCNDMQPIVINYEILYVQAQGGIVRNLSYSFVVNIYTGSDMTVLANHLFANHTLVDWTYAEEPFKLVSAIRDDGVMLTLTFLKEQEVYAWTQDQTLGFYKSINSVREGTTNAVYMIVQRQIEGTWYQYIERRASRFLANAEDAWFLDSALEYPMIYPAAGITASSASGIVIFQTDASAFGGWIAGDVLRMGGGRATLTTVADTDTAQGTWTIEPTNLMSNGIPGPVTEGNWTLSRPVTTVTGLDHLDGQTVGIYADGLTRATAVVDAGSVTISPAATKIIVGLPYYSRFQTLQIDTGDPTIQGKRKKLPSVTIRLNDSKAGKYGLAFANMFPIKIDGQLQDATEVGLISGDATVRLPGLWDTHGQICIEQTEPQPITILAVIPDLVTGDDNAP